MPELLEKKSIFYINNSINTSLFWCDLFNSFLLLRFSLKKCSIIFSKVGNFKILSVFFLKQDLFSVISLCEIKYKAYSVIEWILVYTKHLKIFITGWPTLHSSLAINWGELFVEYFSISLIIVIKIDNIILVKFWIFIVFVK